MPIGDLDIVQRFNFYVQSNRNKKLDLDLTQLSFESLKFLVDSQVQLSELTWAQQQNQISYTTFADAFFAITYDTGRVSATNQAYVWTYPSYKLSDILKDGGICIDQAYFAETVGKGRGIPTIRFTGFGVDGAHAWFGYLANSGKWELDCGRYENQSFPKGFAVDPQSWQPIDDSVLQNLFKNGGKNPDYDPTMTALPGPTCMRAILPIRRFSTMPNRSCPIGRAPGNCRRNGLMPAAISTRRSSFTRTGSHSSPITRT